MTTNVVGMSRRSRPWNQGTKDLRCFRLRALSAPPARVTPVAIVVRGRACGRLKRCRHRPILCSIQSTLRARARRNDLLLHARLTAERSASYTSEAIFPANGFGVDDFRPPESNGRLPEGTRGCLSYYRERSRDESSAV